MFLHVRTSSLGRGSKWVITTLMNRSLLRCGGWGRPGHDYTGTETGYYLYQNMEQGREGTSPAKVYAIGLRVCSEQSLHRTI